MKDVSIKELKNAATRMRMNVVDMIYKAQSGPPAGSLSARTPAGRAVTVGSSPKATSAPSSTLVWRR